MPAALVNMMGDVVHGGTLARTPRQLFEDAFIWVCGRGDARGKLALNSAALLPLGKASGKLQSFSARQAMSVRQKPSGQSMSDTAS